MARRSRLTDVGHVALDSLRELGAGNNGEWLADAAVYAAIHPHYLAFASGSLVDVVHWGETGDVRPTRSVKIRPSLSDFEGEISAIEWVAVGDLVVLALGTSGGYLLFYSLENVLVHKQIVHDGRVLRLRFREVEHESESDDVHAQELCVVMPGVIARFDGLDIKSCLDQSIKQNSPHGWGNRKMEEVDGSSPAKIPYRVWNVSKFGSCADAAITGLMPPPLLELQSEQRHYCAVTIGDDAVISAYRVSERRSRSLVGAILRNALPAAVSTITSLSKLIWRSEKSSVKKPEGVSQSFDKSSPLTCLKDHPRKGEKITLSPSGTLAAITDSLGRILLLDTRALVVVRLWKGYRDACCLFMEMLVRKDKGKSIISTSRGHEYKKGHYCLCLVIHAPRKGIIEVWKMRTGPRVFTIQCPKGSKILQPSSRMVSSTDTSSYIPLEVFILNGVSGQLSVLNRSIG